MNTFFSFVANVLAAIGALFTGVVVTVANFFVPMEPVTVATSTPPVVVVAVATTTLPVVPVVVPVAPKPVPKPPVVVPPVVPKPVPPPVTPPPVVPDPPRGSVGTTTLAVQSIPLLSGGVIKRTGRAVPISYLQITNVGTEGAVLEGFWVKQNGSASVDAVIGLLTVDDRGGSRGKVGGVEGETPFQQNTAFAPTDAYFKPGQMRLFTIKAELAHDLSSYAGTDLKIDVTGLASAAAIQGNFPIVGTTWTIGL